MSYFTPLRGFIDQVGAVAPVMLLLLAVTTPTFGDDARVAALEARIAALEARLAALDAAPSARPAPAAAEPESSAAPVVAIENLRKSLERHVAASSWTERLALRGDLRLRHEQLDQDANDPRQRQRFRLRVGATARTSETATVGFGLASGSDDPISRNETFDTAARSKDIFIEQAFVSWKPADVPGLEVLAGKFRNPLRTTGDSPLVFDGDLNPEGIHLGYERAIGAITLGVAADGWWIDERSASQDSYMLGGQVTARAKVLGGEALLLGGSYEYSNLRGTTPPYNGIARGNSLRGTRLASGFQLREVAVEWVGKAGAMDLLLFGDWVTNAATADADEGYSYGATLARNGWRGGAMWKRVEADAVFATFTDSDFGFGGSDQEGYSVFVSYEPNRTYSFRLRYSETDVGLDTANERNVDRLQMDMSARF